MNATAYGAAGSGQFRNKSNGAKLSQYQGVHGTIQMAHMKQLPGTVKASMQGRDAMTFNSSIMDPHQINNLPLENSNITPQEVAAFYTSAVNAK